MVEQSREQVEEQVREQAREQVLCLVGNNELFSKALAIGLQELKEEEEIYWNVKGQIKGRINKQTSKQNSSNPLKISQNERADRHITREMS